MSTRDIPLTVSFFDRAIAPKGEAIGILEHTTWRGFVERLSNRREGQKDGPCFAPATFATKPDNIHVGRKKNGALARTMIALDIETSKVTGEIPPPPIEALSRARRMGLTALVYTSHNHRPEKDPRYRVVFPVSEQIACEIPACEIMAEEMGLAGVLDISKVGPASLFYLPSCETAKQNLHYLETVDGEPVDADRIIESGIALQHARKVEQDRLAAQAHKLAAERREAKLSAGIDPDDSLIDKIRAHLDSLEQILLSHQYDKSGGKFCHPNSTSGQHGASIKNLGGIDRVFSHNATDPLHESNLPAWCDVTAVDAFDVTAILDFGGNRDKALLGLAEQYGFIKPKENKALAALIFRMIRQRASLAEIKAAAIAEGETLGLSRAEVDRIAQWVASQPVRNAA